MSVELAPQKPKTIPENLNTSFLNNLSNQAMQGGTEVGKVGNNSLLQNSGIEIAGVNNLSSDLFDPSNPNRQGLESLVQEPGNQNNEILSQQLDVATQQNEVLKQNNEILQNQLNQLNQQVSQMVANQVETSTGQPVNPEQGQEASKAVQKEAIEKMKKPRFLDMAKKLFTADISKAIRNASPMAKVAIFVIGSGLLVGGGLVATAGWIPGLVVMKSGLAGMGVTNLALAAGIKGVAAATAGYGAISAFHALRPADKKEQPQPTPEAPAPQTQEQRVVEQSTPQPQFRETIEGNMEQAKNIVRGLEEIKGEKISFMYGESVVELYSKNGEYLYDTTNQGGTVTGETDEKTLTQTLSGYPENVLVSLQQQINDKKAEQSKPVEQLNSPENKEKPFDTIKLSELQPGKIIEVTGTNSEGKEVKLTVRRAENDKLYVTSTDSDGHNTILQDSKIYSTITTNEGNRETITKINDEISNDKNATVDFGGLLKLDVTDAKLVKDPVAEVPQSEIPASTPSPESTKSRETISQSAYAEIGKNLDKINDTAKKPSVDILKGAWGGYFEGANATALGDQLNKSEFLDKLDGYLDNKPVPEGFSTEPEFDNITLLRTCLTIATLDIPKEVKDSLKSNSLPEAITNFKGDSLVGDVLQEFVGPNLEAAKQVLRANKEIERAKKESEKYDNADVKAGVVGAELLKSSNQIVTSQIPQFKDKEGRIWDKKEVIDAIEGDLEKGSTTLSEGKHPIAEQIIKLGNSYREVKTP